MTRFYPQRLRAVFGAALLLTAGLAGVSAPAHATCVGDCNNDGTVTISEVQTCVNIKTGAALLSKCPQADQDNNGTVTDSEVNACIASFLDAATCSQVLPTLTPTATQPVPTATQPVPTATQPAPTATQPVPTATQPAPTATQPAPTATQPAPTATQPAPTATQPVPTATQPVPTATTGTAVCGDGIKNGSEECDDGGTCVGGANDGMKCPSNVPSGVDCGAGGTCTPFGGDGCANNCTNETVVEYTFTGAKCYGGAKNGQDCNFSFSCISGAYLNKPCDPALNGTDCGPPGSPGVCRSECDTSNDGGLCFGSGACVQGPNIGTSCPSNASSTAVPPPPILLCQGGSKTGVACSGDGDCPGGSCVNPCGAGGTCNHQSGAVLQTLNTIPNLISLGVGPLVGREELHIGKAGADGRMPVAIPASSVHFEPVKVTGLACACPRGIAIPDIHGPGNSGSGYIGCGAAGLPNVDVVVVIDHNTTPGDAKNGLGTCAGGTRAGLACGVNTDCPGGGTCSGTGGGGGICITGANEGKVCHADSDCPMSRCAAPDDATCTAQEPPAPEGTGATACKEAKSICTAGPKVGQTCKFNSDCGTGYFCGVTCNSLSPHSGSVAGTFVCNSPTILASQGSGGPGSAIILQTTAIGVISTPDDGGSCTRSAICTGFTLGAATKACLVDAECGAGKTCTGAYCAGKCQGGANVGKACIKNPDCPGSFCVAGANFAKACDGVTDTCGTGNICTVVTVSKGFDGYPCTADDSEGAKGVPATIPSTTGIASSGIADVNDNKNYIAQTPGIIFGDTCSGATSCITQRTGHIFNCQQPVGPAFVSGAQVVSAFPQLDGNTIGDDVVTTGFTAR